MAKKRMTASVGARAVETQVSRLMRAVIPRVETETDICEVILDADGEDFRFHYEYGGREDLQEKTEHCDTELPWHTVKAKNTQALVKKLCRYYRNAECDVETMKQLEAFLARAVPYLYYKCSQEDFCLDSLKKLAEVSNRKDGKSSFDNLMGHSYYISREDYARFNTAYTFWLSRNVISGLGKIGDYLQGKHGTNQIRFVVKKK